METVVLSPNEAYDNIAKWFNENIPYTSLLVANFFH
jgi:hypothetical protein